MLKSKRLIFFLSFIVTIPIIIAIVIILIILVPKTKSIHIKSTSNSPIVTSYFQSNKFTDSDDTLQINQNSSITSDTSSLDQISNNNDTFLQQLADIKAIRNNENKKIIIMFDEPELKIKMSAVLTQQLGKPYVWGTEGPISFDCSGLAQYIYKQIGIDIPRIALEQSRVGKEVNKNDLKYGDLIFFYNNTAGLHHVGIYIGDGMVIHSPHTGDVVKISSILTGILAEEFSKAVRIVND